MVIMFLFVNEQFEMGKIIIYEYGLEICYIFNEEICLYVFFVGEL